MEKSPNVNSFALYINAKLAKTSIVPIYFFIESEYLTMGLLTKMRQFSPYLLGLFAFLFIGFMVASDANLGEIMRRGDSYSSSVVGSVNGVEILRKDFDDRVKEIVDQQRNGNPDAEIDEDQIRQQVWDQMLEETLLKQEAEKAGLRVTSEEIQDIMIDNPPDFLRKDFTDSTGKFNREQYLRVVTNPESIGDNIRALIQEGRIQPNQVDPDSEVAKIKRGLLKIEDFLQKSQLTESMRSLLNIQASMTSPLYLKRKYIVDNSTADVNFIAFDAMKIADKEVNVTDAEISAYYEKFKSSYKQKPMRKMKYVTFPLVPSTIDTNNLAKKVKRIEEEIAKAPTAQQKDSVFELNFASYSGKTNEFVPTKTMDPDRRALFLNAQQRDVIGPVRLMDGTYFFRVDSVRTGTNEQVRASHILINFGSNKDSAKAFADKLYKRAKSGEDFAQMAAQFSSDKGSGSKGGDVDYFGKGRMVKPFEDAAFAASIGTITPPVESQFGYHIIKVVDKASDEIKFSEIKFDVILSNSTRNMIKRDAISFKEQVTSGKQIDTLAKQLKKVGTETVFFDKNTPIIGSRILTEYAFENPVGSVSNPIEVKRFGIVVVQVSDTREAGVKPLIDVKEEIKERLKRIKKLDIIKAKAQDVYNKLKDKDLIARASEIDPSLEIRSAAKIHDNGQVMGLGNEPVFTSKVFESQVGKIVGPIRGERGYYIIQVTDKQMADESKFAAESENLAKTLAQQAKSSAYYQWVASQKENAIIEDNRSKFYRD
ncbi:MAG: peptidylprolyl isomerase [Ignavibacteria bacterium]|nr:peptidylprolyl isomerase [Ignavibacteria bacterium]